jgi:adenosylmethionine---8-amino-7-oxononanoate aminotransferase
VQTTSSPSPFPADEGGGAKPSNDELRRWDRQHYWHSFTPMETYEPLIVERAQGATLIDIDGNRYLDGAASMWCNVHGHNHPAINAAIQAQLEKVAHSTSLGMGNSTTVKLAHRLAEIAPGNLEHVFFSSDGSSAIEVALKAAFQYWRQCDRPKPAKTKFVALGEAYHGDTLGAAAVGGIDRFHALFEPLLFDVIRFPSPDVHRLPHEVEKHHGVDYYLRQLESLLRENHSEIAALVMEPLVQCAAGMVMHPPNFLRGVRELTREYDVLLIVDEVATGFGRTGTMFACEREEIVPDFLCLGKGISGGYLPLSATITHSEIWNAFLGNPDDGRTLYHGHTYSGNPLACAAGLASLELFETERTLERLQAKIARLGEHLDRIAGHPNVANARQCGLIGAFDLVADKQTFTPFPLGQTIGRQIATYALRRGVWLRPQPHFVYVMPPLSISLEELDYLLNTIESGLNVTAYECS